jgi:hypothetical protein
MDKKIFINFEDWWGNNKTTGFTSASYDWAKEIWEELEPTINASKDDYKKAYIKLMEEEIIHRSELVDMLFNYIDEFKQPNQPKFFKWWSDQIK